MVTSFVSLSKHSQFSRIRNISDWLIPRICTSCSPHNYHRHWYANSVQGQSHRSTCTACWRGYQELQPAWWLMQVAVSKLDMMFYGRLESFVIIWSQLWQVIKELLRMVTLKLAIAANQIFNCRWLPQFNCRWWTQSANRFTLYGSIPDSPSIMTGLACPDKFQYISYWLFYQTAPPNQLREVPVL